MDSISKEMNQDEVLNDIRDRLGEMMVRLGNLELIVAALVNGSIETPVVLIGFRDKP